MRLRSLFRAKRRNLLHSSQRLAQATRLPTESDSQARRGLYGEKTVREAERAWFLSGGEESEALIRVAFGSLGQKQRVFDPYSLRLSSIVAAAITQNPGIAIIYSRDGDGAGRQVKIL